MFSLGSVHLVIYSRSTFLLRLIKVSEVAAMNRVEQYLLLAVISESSRTRILRLRKINYLKFADLVMTSTIQ